MPTGRRRLASSLRTAEPSSPNEAKALSNNPADNTTGTSTRLPESASSWQSEVAGRQPAVSRLAMRDCCA